MNSITGLTRQQTDVWAEELRRSDQWLRRTKQRELLTFLNRRETLCTPGFLLRRQLQEAFPHLLREAEGRCGLLPGDYPDLTKAGNVPWPDELTRSLAKVLSEAVFPGFGSQRPGIDSRQWQSYLDERGMCNRATALKLIFALDMDDAAAAKFLLSGGWDLLSVRNPVDLICKYCLEHTPRLTYERAMKLLARFESRRTGTLDGAGYGRKSGVGSAPSFGYGMTTAMDGTLRDLLGGRDGLSTDARAERLIEYMVEHEGEFAPKYEKKNQKHRQGERQYEYASGFSLQNIRMLKVLLKYLAILYPASVGLDEEDRAVNIPVETDGQGVPLVYSHLTQAMFDLQDIDLPEHGELNVPARGKEKLAYDQIPFNENIILPLKNLSAALRAMVRAADNPANARDVNRGTVLLLAYFFITGCQYVPPMGIPAPSEGIEGRIEADLSEADPGEARILHALLDVADLLYDTESDPSGTYISCLNRLLSCFHFSGFYPPFVLDRFVLLCLLADPMNAAMGADDALQYMMQLVISESFRLRREER